MDLDPMKARIQRCCCKVKEGTTPSRCHVVVVVVARWWKSRSRVGTSGNLLVLADDPTQSCMALTITRFTEVGRGRVVVACGRKVVTVVWGMGYGVRYGRGDRCCHCMV